MAFDRAGERVASGGADGVLSIWTLKEERGRSLFDHGAAEDNELTAVAFGPPGTVASGGTDKRVRLWPVDGTDEARTIGRHEGAVLALAFDPEAHYLATGGRDGAVRIWDLSDPVDPGPLAPIEGYKRYVNSVGFSDDGVLVTGSFGATVKVLTGELSHPQLLDLVVRQHDLTAASVGPQGLSAVTGGSDGTLRIWTRDSTEEDFRRSIPPIFGSWGPIDALALSPDGRSIAGAASGDLRLWSVEGEGLLSAPLRGHSDRVFDIGFLRDTMLQSSSEDGTVRLWDISVGTDLGEGDALETACSRLEALRATEIEASLMDEIRDVVRSACNTQP